LACNTTAGQYFSTTAGTFRNLDFHPGLDDVSIPQQWASAIQSTLILITEWQQTPNNYSAMNMCVLQPEYIASGNSWDMFIKLQADEGTGSQFQMLFNSTGQLQNDVTELVPLLVPEMVKIEGINFEAWCEYIGRTFYVLYWLYLADLGQITSIVADSSNVTIPTHPSLYSDINNVFVNESLYRNYLDYYESSTPLSMPVFTTQEAELISSFNPLQPIDTMFLQSYSCQQRQLKSGASLLLALIVADYPFVVGGFSLVIWVAATFLQKRKRTGFFLSLPQRC
jgi:hypothetical protein